ncbi:MAG TPA: HEPN domain-containing protein [Methylomirabilota bacterium]|nr:HEPN domain-containing protein [Methylomirabilota bacterium]
MPHDPALVAETRDWLTRASKDLEAAERLMIGASPLPSQAAFHAQQTAEKARKAFLTWHKRIFPKTHDLSELGPKCASVDATLGPVSSSVARFSRYAIQTRYPGPWGAPTVAEAQDAISLARAMYDAVIARLPNEVKP